MISHKKIRALGQFTTAVLPLLGTPALAAGPEASSVVAMLGLSGQQITSNELRGIRGGFDLSPSLSVSFAFKQIEAVNGIIVQTITVPEVTVTGLNASTKTASSSVIPSVTSAADKTITTSSPSVTVTNAAGSTQTITPSASSTINLTAKANNGLTVINTQLGNSGLSNMTANQANNTAVSVATTMNIGISGLSQFLTQQENLLQISSRDYIIQGAPLNESTAHKASPCGMGEAVSL